MNLTHAIISLYRGETPDITVIALSSPVRGATGAKKVSEIHWTTLGKKPDSYAIFLDDRMVERNVTKTDYELALDHVSHGNHRLRVVAHGAKTYFDLNPQRPTTRSSIPLPVTAEIDFEN
jgi:hypothetical protein